ncbi:MAG: hypothetical protein KGR47_01020 [Acidobacteria bacterium]|nr:hypothetical protein [Acidobacteriota bacterium]
MNRRTPAVVVAAALAVGGCSSTYDPSLATTATTAVATTSTLPTGTVAELLPRMLDEVKGLSEKVAANEGDNASAALIDQYWQAIRAEVEAKHPDLVDGFEFVVRRCQAASERRRPADADRAYRNLKAIADALLG